MVPRVAAAPVKLERLREGLTALRIRKAGPSRMRGGYMKDVENQVAEMRAPLLMGEP